MKQQFNVSVGTYTLPIRFGTGQVFEGKGRGIYSFLFDLRTKKLSFRGLSEGIDNPSYLAVSGDGRFLYTVNELKEYRGMESGAVSAFSIDEGTGALTLLNQMPTYGADPCHVVLNRDNTHAVISNYTGGSLCLYRIRPDGSLGERTQQIAHSGFGANASRQLGPHAHSVAFAPGERFALAADLGIDELKVYRTDFSKGVFVSDGLSGFKTAPGAGPRCCAFHPDGSFCYLLNEIDSTVSALRWHEDGRLQELQSRSTLPAGFAGDNIAADIHIAPDGGFLYVSNRGHDSITAYRVDRKTGLLDMVETVSVRGRTPRDFAIDPTGRFLLAGNQDSDSISVFEIDPQTGKLSFASQTGVPTPVCICIH